MFPFLSFYFLETDQDDIRTILYFLDRVYELPIVGMGLYENVTALAVQKPRIGDFPGFVCLQTRAIRRRSSSVEFKLKIGDGTTRFINAS